MTKTFAYECFADGDVLSFLQEDCGFPLKGFHAHGQGRVVEAVLVKRTAEIGMVDEDPFASHHSERDRAEIVATTTDLDVRRRGAQHVIIIKPALEECFLRSAKRVGLPSTLPHRAGELRAMLNIRGHSKHRAFREELAALRRESKARDISTFVIDLERFVQGLVD